MDDKKIENQSPVYNSYREQTKNNALQTTNSFLIITARETVQRRNVCMKRWDLTAQKNALVMVELKHRALYQSDFRSFVMKAGRIHQPK